MRKQKTVQRLTLHRETLRCLAAEETAEAMGGAVTGAQTCLNTCRATCLVGATCAVCSGAITCKTC